MPYVNIKITREGATAQQKARLIKGATQLLVDVLGKNPATTVVVIDEVDRLIVAFDQIKHLLGSKDERKFTQLNRPWPPAQQGLTG